MNIKKIFAKFKKRSKHMKSYTSLNIEESANSIKLGAIILDVREKHEYIQVHIENSILIPLSEISADRVKQINPQKKTIIIHCAAGVRSKKAANILHSQNYNSEILEIDKGINEWIKSNKPVVSEI
tara:strand:- start:467 stop:844 length:378 start_codon:yes stop_codon:yes gene_type:complete